MNVAVMPLYVTVPVTGVVPCFKVKVVVESVRVSIVSLKVADTAPLTATLVALLTGEVCETVGAVVSGAAPVVKVQT